MGINARWNRSRRGGLAASLEGLGMLDAREARSMGDAPLSSECLNTSSRGARGRTIRGWLHFASSRDPRRSTLGRGTGRAMLVW